MSWTRWVSTGVLVAGLVGCATGGGRPTAGGASASGAALAPPAEAASAGLERVVLALPSVAGVFVPHVLAQEKGFFRAEGLDVEMPVMRSNLVTAALLAGEADYSGLFGAAVRDILSGMPFRLIVATVDKSTRWIMGAPGVQSIEQLRGKAIAVSVIGSGPYNSGVLALEHFGIDPHSEVTWYAAGLPSERLLAVQQGAAQASIFAGSEVPRVEAAGLVRLLRLHDVVPLPESGVSTSVAKLESNRPQVKRLVRAMIRAVQYVKSDREGTLPAYMQFLSISREEAEEAHDAILSSYSDDGTMSERALRYNIDAEKQQLKLTGDFPSAGVAEFGPLHEALTELGITPAAGSAH